MCFREKKSYRLHIPLGEKQKYQVSSEGYKGPVIRATYFSSTCLATLLHCKLKHIVARITMFVPTCLAAKYNVVSLGNMLRKVDSSATVHGRGYIRTVL